jgi:chromosome segregation ATPase
LEAELATLEEKAKADSDSLAKSTKEIQALGEKSTSTQKQLALAQEELGATSKKLQALQLKSSEDGKALEIAEAALAKSEQEVTSLQQMMDTFDADGRSRDELHNKVKAELAATVKSLEDKTKEISSLQQKHQKEVEQHQKQLENVSNDYQKEIDSLQGNWMLFRQSMRNSSSPILMLLQLMLRSWKSLSKTMPQLLLSLMIKRPHRQSQSRN